MEFTCQSIWIVDYHLIIAQIVVFCWWDSLVSLRLFILQNGISMSNKSDTSGIRTHARRLEPKSSALDRSAIVSSFYSLETTHTNTNSPTFITTIFAFITCYFTDITISFSLFHSTMHSHKPSLRTSIPSIYHPNLHCKLCMIL